MGLFDSIFGPPTTKTTSTNTSANQQSQTANSNSSVTGQTSGLSTTNPNLPDWYNQFLQTIPSQYQNLGAQYQGLNKPLYGQQQEANFRQGLNQQTGQSMQTLIQQLAKSGALNSGRTATSLTGLNIAKNQNLNNYLTQTPLLNAQFKQANLGQQGSLLNSASQFKIPYGSTTTQDQASNQQSLSDAFSQLFGNQSSSGTQTQTQSGGLFQSLLGGLIQAGLGAATSGLGSLGNVGGSVGGQSPIPGYDPGSYRPNGFGV